MAGRILGIAYRQRRGGAEVFAARALPAIDPCVKPLLGRLPDAVRASLALHAHITMTLFTPSSPVPLTGSACVQVNASIGQVAEPAAVVGVLDIYGFEQFKTNDFEQARRSTRGCILVSSLLPCAVVLQVPAA